MTNLRSAQQGQTLLIVIFAMSLGLLVMVNTASRVVASVARTAQTNNYQKATAVAEAGAEVFLAKSISGTGGLQDYAVSGGLYCPTTNLADLTTVDGSNCTVTLGEAKAYLGVEVYPKSGEKGLRIRSQPGETIHINLQDASFNPNSIQVCWKGLGKASYSASYYFYYYGTVGDYSVDKNLFTCKGGLTNCSLPGTSEIDHVDEATPDGDYSCYAFWGKSDAVALRIFTFPDGADYLISAYDDSSDELIFPRQGYRIISIGEVTGGGGGSLESRKATRKKVTVEKTFPYPTGPWWDFAVTSVEGSVKTTL